MVIDLDNDDNTQITLVNSSISSDYMSDFQNKKETSASSLKNPCFTGCLYEKEDFVYGFDLSP
jgi:hypothetical protein